MLQGAFFSVFTRLREQGVLTVHARGALEAVDDYLRCIATAIAEQVLENLPVLKQTLADTFK